MIKPIVITLGEPAGIGPDILLKLAKRHTFPIPLVVAADPELLHERAVLLNTKIELPQYSSDSSAPISILPISLKQRCYPGKPDTRNSAYVLQTLQRATAGCLQHEFSALVTGPVNKAVINQSGVTFQGHTEYLAALTHTKKTVMLFVYESLRLALLTTHIPLIDVAKYITRENIIDTMHIIQSDMKKYFNLATPRFAVTGLNPHAGENGYLGTEEQTIMIPALHELHQQHFSIQGPLSADTLFHRIKQSPVDVILSMYHDQTLPVIKALGFGKVVNVTLGLPMIRTSVDHGTAFELAGTQAANEISLVEAINLAIDMVKGANHDGTFSQTT